MMYGKKRFNVQLCDKTDVNTGNIEVCCRGAPGNSIPIPPDSFITSKAQKGPPSLFKFEGSERAGCVLGG